MNVLVSFSVEVLGLHSQGACEHSVLCCGWSERLSQDGSRKMKQSSDVKKAKAREGMKGK